MSKRKATKPKESDLFPTGNLDLVNYLLLYQIEPIKQEMQGKTATLFYERTPALDQRILDFMNPCEKCGIRFSEVGPARAKARRLLVDGLPE